MLWYIPEREGYTQFAISSHPLDRSTARCHAAQAFSLWTNEVRGANVLLPLVLTSASVSGFERSHPNKPIAAPASRAEPSAVDLSKAILSIQSRELAYRHLLPHLGPNNLKAPDICQDLHTGVSVCHPSVNLEVFEVGLGVQFYAV